MAGTVSRGRDRQVVQQAGRRRLAPGARPRRSAPRSAMARRRPARGSHPRSISSSIRSASSSSGGPPSRSRSRRRAAPGARASSGRAAMARSGAIAAASQARASAAPAASVAASRGAALGRHPEAPEQEADALAMRVLQRQEPRLDARAGDRCPAHRPRANGHRRVGFAHASPHRAVIRRRDRPDVLPPAAHRPPGEAEEVERAADRLVDHLGQGLRRGVEGGHAAGRSPRPSRRAATMVRRCPRCSGVSRTISTSVRRSFSVTSAARVISDDGHAGGDLAHRPHRAGRDDHAAGGERARGDRRADVGRRGSVTSALAATAARSSAVSLGDGQRRGARDHQVGRHAQLAAGVQHPHAQHRPRRARDADDERGVVSARISSPLRHHPAPASGRHHKQPYVI